jgi:GDPmannose 4,6-dehydratase
MKSALISGFPGQDACYLAEFLLDKGYKVFGIIKRYTAPNYTNLDFLGLRNRANFHLITADVTDIGSLFDAVEIAQPDEIYNLAAQSYVGHSWRLAFTTAQVDATGPLNFLEVIRRTNPKTKFYQAATSEMFGNNSTNGVQSEETAFMPASPYGVAKLYGFHITKNFRESYGLFACSGILFNHESPIRGIEFVTRKVTDGVAQIKAGKANQIKLGNLGAERDWGHAKDFVRAQWMMLQQEEADDFIVATGKKHTIGDLCRTAFDAAGIDDWKQFVVSDPEFVRPHDLVSLHASSDKAQRVLGWKPEISFKNMIEEMVHHDLKRHGL